MTSKNTEIIKFKYQFLLPTKDFKETERKELTVTLTHNQTTSQHYDGSHWVGTSHSEKAFFVVEIPKYVREYVKEKLKQYTKDGIGIQGYYEGGAPIYEEKFDFKNFLRFETLKALDSKMTEITMDALHIKRFEDLEQHSKVIFVHSKYDSSRQKDPYNFGLMGNKIDLSFQFFVAYKVMKKKAFIKDIWQEGTDDENIVYEYYALEQAPSNYGGNKKLPILDAHKLKGFVQIPWSEEREKFLTDIEHKIRYVAKRIDEYVTDISTENIDMMISQHKYLKLEDKSDNISGK